MKLNRILLACCAVLCLVATTGPRAAADEASDAKELLKQKGLTLVGRQYLLRGDADLKDALDKLHDALHKSESQQKRQAEIQKQIGVLNAKADDLRGAWATEKAKLDAADQRAVGSYNHQVDRYNAVVYQIRAVNDAVAKLTAAMDAIGDPAAAANAGKAEYAGFVLDVDRRYKALAEDADVKTALDAVNHKAGTPYTLGPSDRLTRELDKARAYLKEPGVAALAAKSSGNGGGKDAGNSNDSAHAAAPRKSTKPDDKITIVKATYGSGDQTADVTEQLSKAVEHDRYTPAGADNTCLGDTPDPCPGQVKRLHVVYQLGGEKHELDVDEGHAAPLLIFPPEGVPDPKAGQELKIIAARYGVPAHWNDVTDDVARQFTDPTQALDLYNENLGGDPADGHHKTLVVYFSYKGRDFVASGPEESGVHNFRLLSPDSAITPDTSGQ